MSAGDMPVLSVDAVSISFTDRDDRDGSRARTVVDHVSFDLRAGRVLALVGESGSGKSVTAMSTLGLLPAGATVTGSVRLLGEELLGADPARLRAVRGGRVGTIFQEPMTAFDPVLTIGRQITEALGAHGRAAGRSETRDRVADLLTSVGISDPARVARSHPHELSGGQLQRAMIAMAISCDPVALIADEPTTALDVTVQAGILDLIRELRDRLGTAVLLITHDMGVVADLADDVVVMREGDVVERADAATLFAHPEAEYTRRLLAAVPRLDDLRLDDAADARAVAASDEPVDAAAQLERASVTYRGRGWGAARVDAVSEVTLSIRPGRIFGLVGESGSGKSTLGRALAGLVPLSSGSATVAGVQLADASRSELRLARSRIGYVFQDPASSLNPRSTIEQAISEPLRLHSDLSRSAQRERVRELLDAVRLEPSIAGRYQHELSGGQRQRVAVARAIALRPALLIADEPTSALDVSVQAAVLDLLRDLQSSYGFACLFISHDLAVVRDLADEVAVMNAGRIVEQGTTATVLRSPVDPYTQRLLAAAPVPDPEAQRRRREEWRALVA